MKTHYIIPIFVPHLGCEHDCVFCNQRVITGQQQAARASDVTKIVLEHLATIPQHAYKEIAFYGGSFTGIPIAEQERLLAAAYAFKQKKIVDGIRISTRPDYISSNILELMLKYEVTTIELGVQSLDEQVLEKARRGHDKKDILTAVAVIRQFDFNLGIQLMVGLPGDDAQKAVDSAQEVALLKPDFVRIYPAVVLAGTTLAELYRENSYQPLSLYDAVQWSAMMLLVFEQAEIPVIRIGLQPSADISVGGSIIAGPFHPAFRELVESEIAYLMMSSLVQKLCSKPYGVTFWVNPRNISVVIGQKRTNIKKLCEEYGVLHVTIHPQSSIQRGELVLAMADDVYYGLQITKKELAGHELSQFQSLDH